MPEKIVTTTSSEQTSAIFGIRDENISQVEAHFGVRITNAHTTGDGSGDAIFIRGEEENVEKAAEVLEYFKRMTSAGETLAEQSVEYVIGMVADGLHRDLKDLGGDVICVTTRGKPIKPKTVGQRKYVDAIRHNTVVLGIGPAGTGKTFLAVAMAVDALRNKTVSRIVLTRPAVEAGENLGFLPGDLQSKIDPYLRPLYDALFEMLGAENYARHVERNTIEIAPLAYMRGRTLDDSFIILDEAQNTTSEQMKMFLTRLGNRSRAVVTGDPSQTDLPFGKKSGLSVAAKILKNIEGIAIHQFTERDVVRHKLVQQIITAYERHERESKAHADKPRSFKVKRLGGQNK
ncbi:MAG: PhoH family protein [Eubacteriales bacterium]